MEALAKARGKGFAQAFDAECIVGEKQVLLAYEQAEKSFAGKANSTNSLEMEVLVRAAGTTKIDDAIARIGVKDLKNVLVAAGGKEVAKKLGEELKPAFAPNNEKVKKVFGLDEKALAGYELEQLVLERVALSALE